MQAMFERLKTGRWPNTNPAELNAAAAELPAKFQLVYDYPTGDAPASPALTNFTPGVPLRPSR